MPWHAFAPLLLLLLLLPLPLPLPHPRYLLVYVDHFTKWSRAWALKTKKREYAKKRPFQTCKWWHTSALPSCVGACVCVYVCVCVGVSFIVCYCTIHSYSVMCATHCDFIAHFTAHNIHCS